MVAPQVVPGDKVATAPGDRIAYVMFVGQLPNMPAGYWVGVQYEEKVGKNDGTLHGKRYFTCPPGHGGFLRSAKVQSLEDLASKNEAREAASSRRRKARIGASRRARRSARPPRASRRRARRVAGRARPLTSRRTRERSSARRRPRRRQPAACRAARR